MVACRFSMSWCKLVVLAYLSLNVQAQIKVLAPDRLKDYYKKSQGVILGATSVFGAPYYGERVLGRLRGSMTEAKRHCEDSDYELIELHGEIDSPQGEKVHDIVVIPHSKISCSAVTKVKVAQGKGAHAVILVDQTGMSDDDVKEQFPSDDGFGSEVRIPSILVSQGTGEKLFNAMRQDPVVVELSWDVPIAEVATLDFWHSSAAQEPKKFLTDFREPAEVLGSFVSFKPHYYIFDLPKGAGAGDLCTEIASPAGMVHCAPDPDGPGPITGRDVAEEDIRQLCLFHRTATRQNVNNEIESLYSKEWWEYVTRFFDHCPLDSKDPNWRFGSEQCSYNLMVNLNVMTDEVKKCVEHHAEEYLEDSASNHAWSEQALRINGWRYKGSLDSELVLKAVCQSFPVPNPQCTALFGGTFTRLVTLLTHRVTSSGVSEHVFALVLLAICLLGLINCFLYKRCLMKLMRKQMREEVMLEVQSQMTEYSKL